MSQLTAVTHFVQDPWIGAFSPFPHEGSGGAAWLCAAEGEPAIIKIADELIRRVQARTSEPAK